MRQHPTQGETAYARMLRGERGLAERLLAAGTTIAAAGFGLAVRARTALYDRNVWPWIQREAGVPVLSVGNLSVGGTGKSLEVAYLAGDLWWSSPLPEF